MFHNLDEVGDVHGHLLNLGVVELLDVAEDAHVVLNDEVDGDTLTTLGLGLGLGRRVP